MNIAAKTREIVERMAPHQQPIVHSTYTIPDWEHLRVAALGLADAYDELVAENARLRAGISKIADDLKTLWGEETMVLVDEHGVKTEMTFRKHPEE